MPTGLIISVFFPSKLYVLRNASPKKKIPAFTDVITTSNMGRKSESIVSYYSTSINIIAFML